MLCERPPQGYRLHSAFLSRSRCSVANRPCRSQGERRARVVVVVFVLLLLALLVARAQCQLHAALLLMLLSALSTALQPALASRLLGVCGSGSTGGLAGGVMCGALGRREELLVEGCLGSQDLSGVDVWSESLVSTGTWD